MTPNFPAGAATYRQEDFVAPRAPFARTRASSFDAPQQQARPGSPGGAALVNVIPSEQQVDGVGPMATSPRADTHPPTHIDEVHDNAAARIHPDASSSAGGVYTHPSMNASAPALNHFTSSPSMRPTPPGTAASRRRITFASNLSVHTTWPAAIYDRRAEPATCNRLTPLLAQQIKEELNSFKMEEMDVHPLSRKLTHFCASRSRGLSLADPRRSPLPATRSRMSAIGDASHPPIRKNGSLLRLFLLDSNEEPASLLSSPLYPFCHL